MLLLFIVWFVVGLVLGYSIAKASSQQPAPPVAGPATLVITIGPVREQR